MDVAKQEIALPITKMHAVSLTIAEKIAIMALARPHPLTIAIGLKTVFPHIHEIILIDVALMVVATDAGAS